ncbi:MAG: cysteine desulfurase [Phycisphaeraceae bacterium]|nr:cysteine desulfurase [Phycisphaeraceae bacterium]
MIYLDNNATTRPCEAAIQAADFAMREAWQNPSSVHRAGQNARARIEMARKSIADLVGCKPRELTFVSSGTESIQLAIRGVVQAQPRHDDPPLVVSTRVEHSAVRELLTEMEARGEARVRWLEVDENGVVKLDSVAESLASRPALVSVQWVNNETGVIQPVAQTAALCNSANVLFHCDGVQWVGKETTRIGAGGLNCALLSLSAHKFHGLKGVGCLYVRPGVRLRPQNPGSQELGRRGGTENVPGILAAGAAAEEARTWLAEDSSRAALDELRNEFEERVLAGCPGARVNGAGAARIWNTTSIGFPKLEAEAVLLALSESGVCASAGAACASGSLDPSPVLLAMGVPAPIAHGTVRFSLSRESKPDEITRAAEIVVRCVGSLRASTGTAV